MARKAERQTRQLLLAMACVLGFLAFVPALAPATAQGAEPIAAYSFDEGKGSIARDSAGNHDGTVEGAEWTEGKYDSTLNVDIDCSVKLACVGE